MVCSPHVKSGLMVEVDNSHIKQLVEALRAEGSAYYKQWAIWLAVGSASGCAALVALATKLPNPNFAFFVFVPSFWAFFVGIMTAALSILFSSLKMSSAAEHFAEAHNREQFNTAIKNTPEFFSSPKHIADEQNRARNEMIEQSKKSHLRAENAWSRHIFWRRAQNASGAISAAAFVIGMAWPIAYLSFGGVMIPK
jgi:hypothetical protein